MKKTCSTCLNAYNSRYFVLPQCINKEWQSQFRSLDCSVRSDESCATWQCRNENQPSLRFPVAVQLELFNLSDLCSKI